METEANEILKNCPLPIGYKLLSNLGYYKIIIHAVDWYEAVEFCKNEGTHLLVINSKEEEDVVVSLIREYGVNVAYWTGVHDQYEEGHYLTIFSKYISIIAALNYLLPFWNKIVNLLN